jgi:hypothetical protein
MKKDLMAKFTLFVSILIVDDELDITLTLGKGLEQGEYDVQYLTTLK